VVDTAVGSGGCSFSPSYNKIVFSMLFIFFVYNSLFQGNLKRGSSLFMRYYKGPVILKDGKPIAAKIVFQDSF
jgi:hypothetical protein